MKSKSGWKVFLGFGSLYLVLFFQLPWRGELPGNTDTLIAISLSNLILEKIELFFHGLSGLTALYPAHDVLAYGENCYGLAFIFLFFRVLTRSDIWGYYFFLSALFTLNSFAIFKLTSLFVKEDLVAILSGIVFSLANFTLANVDDPNVVFIFFPAMAIYFLFSGIRSKRVEYLAVGFLLSGAQIWFGFYVFAFQSLVLALFCLTYFETLKELLGFRIGAILAAAYFVSAGPLMGIYLCNHFYADVASPYGNPGIRINSSISWYHFRNVLPNNLLYSSAHNIKKEADYVWYWVRKFCFPGLGLPVLALLGVWESLIKRKRAGLLLGIFLVFFVLSFGENLPFFHYLIRFPLGDYFRVVSRLYLFALLSLSVYVGMGVEWFAGRVASRSELITKGMILCIAVVYLLENVPFPLQGYKYDELLPAPKAYQRFFEKFSERQVVLDLPSTILARIPDHGNLSDYNREALYMNWQTQHRQLIVGGVNSYLPKRRLAIDKYIQRLPDEEAFSQIRKAGVKFIVFHKDLVLFPGEDILSKLKRSPKLRLDEEGENLAIFEILEG